jgi:hypothetical protein
MKEEEEGRTSSDSSFSLPPSSFEVRPWLLHLLPPLLAGAALVAGALLVGRLAERALKGRGRSVLAFADVACEPPPGLSREEFLGEVQYLSGLPDELDLLAADLAPRLARAFAGHPWVASVERVRKGGGSVQVELAYRTPVLAVPLPGRGTLRVVDGQGVLLPVLAQTARLPVLKARVAPPAGRPGRAWGDARVASAAKVCAALGPHLAALGLEGCKVEEGPDGLLLEGRQARVLWGKAPADETRVERLLRRAREGGLPPGEHDVRGEGGP